MTRTRDVLSGPSSKDDGQCGITEIAASARQLCKIYIYQYATHRIQCWKFNPNPEKICGPREMIVINVLFTYYFPSIVLSI